MIVSKCCDRYMRRSTTSDCDFRMFYHRYGKRKSMVTTQSGGTHLAGYFGPSEPFRFFLKIEFFFVSSGAIVQQRCCAPHLILSGKCLNNGVSNKSTVCHYFHFFIIPFAKRPRDTPRPPSQLSVRQLPPGPGTLIVRRINFPKFKTIMF